jgi:hypothetical protein
VTCEELRTELKTMWRETTRASNWMVRQLALADVQREPGLVKMPAMPRTYLYPAARAQFPLLPAQTLAALRIPKHFQPILRITEPQRDVRRSR